MKSLVEKFKKGSIYAITSRVGGGKTQFCLNLVAHITANDGEILFLTDSLDISDINGFIAKTTHTSQIRVCFRQAFYLNQERLKEYLSEKKYDYLILDPFDIYAYDIDFGELKEFAMENNIVVIVTKSLSRPSLSSQREEPNLSDVKFDDKQVQRKFIAYTDIILFLERKRNTNDFRALVGKDIHGEIGRTIELDLNANN